MAVLEKIRVKLGILITVLIAVALLSFIIDPQTLETTLSYFSSKYDVGKVDGKKIRYNDFQKEVDYYTNIYTLTTGSQSVSEEAMRSINESAWQSIISERYVVPQMRKAGISVGEDELVDLSQGKEISPVLAQDPVFFDATGSFSREKLLEFIHAIPGDPSGNLAQYWNFLQQNMTTQQYFTKYTSMLSGSDIITPVELRRQIEENNTSSDVEFVLVPFGFKVDTTITVTNKEIQDYYNAHKENYRQTASRDVEFVAYEVVPSEADIQAAEDDINEVYEEFSTTSNLKSFLSLNSDTPLLEYYYKKGELENEFPEIDEFAFSRNPGVMPVFRKDNTFYAVRVSDVKNMSDSAYVRHILLSYDSEALADSLVNVLNHGGDFSDLASRFSLDQNPNVPEPGDLGWLTQTSMIPGMQGVLSMRPGSIEKMETDYGLHIVTVKERTTPVKKVQLAILTKEALPSKETFQDFYAKANDLASRCEGKLENFEKITAEENLPVVPANRVAESARQLSRYDDVREVIRWIYDDKTKVGDVSPIITVNNDVYFVVALKEIREEGYAPVNSVASSITYILTNQKRAEKAKAETAARIAGLTDINVIADTLGQTVSTKDGITFGSMSGSSTDPSFIGAVAGAEPGVISGPVAGNIGVYVFKVNNRETGAFYTEDDARIKAAQVESYQLNSIPSIFSKRAEIKDNRARFY
ncbi:MAG TPA: SurA N-terminal domain-containing protein [Candidatus Coprenecus stercoravium]|uniref:Periplasmic chaperone PpiD n=1 Tax=Candidatus Coprenecus stercoravium TaxID=2840735 RepID=A0A9D2KAN6_9BACT|nr:SurA N-terminal domain-containing protein [Candidatus Coprenecus stercoravium]